MSVQVLKQQIKSALDKGKDAKQTADSAVNVDSIRQETADAIALAVQNYLKTSLTTVIGSGVAIPQDGGMSLKTTMQTAINSI